MPRRLDAVDAAVRESTHLVREPLQFLDGVRATQVHKAENQPPGSVPIHETDLQLAYRIEQYQAARDRRECCLNDIERESRVSKRLGECTLKLEELYQEARLAVRDSVS